MQTCDWYSFQGLLFNHLQVSSTAGSNSTAWCQYHCFSCCQLFSLQDAETSSQLCRVALFKYTAVPALINSLHSQVQHTVRALCVHRNSRVGERTWRKRPQQKKWTCWDKMNLGRVRKRKRILDYYCSPADSWWIFFSFDLLYYPRSGILCLCPITFLSYCIHCVWHWFHCCHQPK